jgi:hypothetical protein
MPQTFPSARYATPQFLILILRRNEIHSTGFRFFCWKFIHANMWSEKDFLHDREEATPLRDIQRREAGLARKKKQTRKTAVEIAACDDSPAFVCRSVHDSGDLDATMSARHWTVSFEQ